MLRMASVAPLRFLESIVNRTKSAVSEKEDPMNHLRFLIIDGYSEKSRKELEVAGMKLAWVLYRELLLRHLPDAVCEVWMPSDPGKLPPSEIDTYDGILWTGCNLTIYDKNNKSVDDQVAFAKHCYEVGVPAFGTCWGIQMAAFAAGGEVKANPRGREMGIARKLRLAADGIGHPFYAGKPHVFDGFISHLDEIVTLPPGSLLLASGDFTHVQSIEVRHKKGVFWGIQYHVEYDLSEMASLIVAREQKLVPEGFFRDHDDLVTHVGRMKALAKDPNRKDLRFQLGIDDDILDPGIRECEFGNWINRLVIPTAARRRGGAKL